MSMILTLSRNYCSVRTLGVRQLSFFDKADRSWEKAWSQNLTPWDTGNFCKPLVDEVKSGAITIATPSRALVPGCGSGHDCFFLHESGFSEVIGLDLSQTAIDVCNATTLYPAYAKESIKFECADFFSYENGKFDFVFDYLFFSALDPDLRGQWATSMARQLTPHRGRLFTLMFPVDGSKGSKDGPPYNVHPDDYKVLEA